MPTDDERWIRCRTIYMHPPVSALSTSQSYSLTFWERLLYTQFKASWPSKSSLSPPLTLTNIQHGLIEASSARSRSITSSKCSDRPASGHRGTTPRATSRCSIYLTMPQIESMEEIPSDESKLQTPVLAVDIKTSFPQSEIFGVKLVNGHPTRAVLDIANHEPQAITLQVIGGSLVSPLDTPSAADPPVVVRNLTAQKYGVQIPAGESESVTYSFATELHPQDLRLNIAAILQNTEGAVFTKMVYNETVSVVEAPMSIFDPQM